MMKQLLYLYTKYLDNVLNKIVDFRNNWNIKEKKRDRYVLNESSDKVWEMSSQAWIINTLNRTFSEERKK